MKLHDVNQPIAWINISLTNQGSKGIMADILMYKPNRDTQNYPFCRLKLVVEMFEHLT